MTIKTRIFFADLLFSILGFVICFIADLPMDYGIMTFGLPALPWAVQQLWPKIAQHAWPLIVSFILGMLATTAFISQNPDQNLAPGLIFTILIVLWLIVRVFLLGKLKSSAEVTALQNRELTLAGLFILVIMALIATAFHPELSSFALVFLAILAVLQSIWSRNIMALFNQGKRSSNLITAIAGLILSSLFFVQAQKHPDEEGWFLYFTAIALLSLDICYGVIWSLNKDLREKILRALPGIGFFIKGIILAVWFEYAYAFAALGIGTVLLYWVLEKSFMTVFQKFMALMTAFGIGNLLIAYLVLSDKRQFLENPYNYIYMYVVVFLLMSWFLWHLITLLKLKRELHDMAFYHEKNKKDPDEDLHFKHAEGEFFILRFHGKGEPSELPLNHRVTLKKGDGFWTWCTPGFLEKETRIAKDQPVFLQVLYKSGVHTDFFYTGTDYELPTSFDPKTDVLALKFDYPQTEKG